MCCIGSSSSHLYTIHAYLILRECITYYIVLRPFVNLMHAPIKNNILANSIYTLVFLYCSWNRKKKLCDRFNVCMHVIRWSLRAHSNFWMHRKPSIDQIAHIYCVTTFLFQFITSPPCRFVYYDNYYYGLESKHFSSNWDVNC